MHPDEPFLAHSAMRSVLRKPPPPPLRDGRPGNGSGDQDGVRAGLPRSWPCGTTGGRAGPSPCSGVRAHTLTVHVALAVPYAPTFTPVALLYRGWARLAGVS